LAFKKLRVKNSSWSTFQIVGVVQPFCQSPKLGDV